jgi:hypothetical protein
MNWQLEQHGPRLCFIASAETTGRLMAEAERQLARRRGEQLDRPLAAQEAGDVARKADRLDAEFASAKREVEAAQDRRAAALEEWTAALEAGRDGKAERTRCDQADGRLAAAVSRRDALGQLVARCRRDAAMERTALIRRMALRTLHLANEAETAAAARGEEALDALARAYLAARMLAAHAAALQKEGSRRHD